MLYNTDISATMYIVHSLVLQIIQELMVNSAMEKFAQIQVHIIYTYIQIVCVVTNVYINHNMTKVLTYTHCFSGTGGMYE